MLKSLYAKDSDLRPVRAEGFHAIPKYSKIRNKTRKKLFVNLLFDPGHDLEERIINEQFDNS